MFSDGVFTQLSVLVLSNTASLRVDATMGSFVSFVTLYKNPIADATLTTDVTCCARAARSAHVATFVNNRIGKGFFTEAEVVQVLVQRSSAVGCSKVKQGRS